MIGYEVLADKIVYFKGALPDINWIDYIESNKSIWEPWVKDTYDQGTLYNKRYGYKKIISARDNKDEEIKKLIESLDECTSIYRSLYKTDLQHGENKNVFVFTKYDAGEPIYERVDLQEHIDINGDYEEYSYVIYFNDNYDEGELEFPKFNIKIKPEALSIVLFPSGDPYSHVAHKSKNGQKYFISHFWKAGAGAGYGGSY